MTDLKEFEIALLKHSKTKEDIAVLLGIRLQTLYNKLNNLVDFKVGEVEKICVFLNLSLKDMMRIFFAKQVEQNSTI